VQTPATTTKTNPAIVLAATFALTWCLSAGGAGATEITISAGEHAWPSGPICLAPRDGVLPDRVYRRNFNGEQCGFAQADHEGRLWWWSAPMKPGEKRSYELELLRSGKEITGIHIWDKHADEGRIDVSRGDRRFATLNFKKDEPKVYLYPVIGPTGDPVTRDYPMKDNPIEKDNKRQDHHHHRSIWCAHGEVRTPNFDGTANYWHETEPAKQDRQILKRIVHATSESGPVFVEIQAEIEWATHTGVRQFTELRTYTFFASNDERIIDIRNIFKFTDCDATFLDTKEGGILSVRTAVTMDERGVTKPKKMHGQMTNIHGQKGEKECWGKASGWCDYVGPVLSRDAETASTVGIAVFDHPKNFRHPTRWHIRGYGLYTANPFGLGHFTRDKKQNGSHTWKKGEAAEFNYRILIHKGDTKAARVADQWRLYSQPPKVTAK